jgi:hypothetical protein
LGRTDLQGKTYTAKQSAGCLLFFNKQILYDTNFILIGMPFAHYFNPKKQSAGGEEMVPTRPDSLKKLFQIAL